MNLEIGDVIFYHGRHTYSKAIQWFTRSTWSHVDAVVACMGRGYFTISAEWFGVFPIFRSYHEVDDIAVCRPNLDKETLDKAVEFLFEATIQRRFYDYRGIVGYALSYLLGRDRNIWQSKSSFHCSELVESAFRYAGHPLVLSKSDPAQVSPEDLWEVLRGNLVYIDPKLREL